MTINYSQRLARGEMLVSGSGDMPIRDIPRSTMRTMLNGFARDNWSSLRYDGQADEVFGALWAEQLWYLTSDHSNTSMSRHKMTNIKASIVIYRFNQINRSAVRTRLIARDLIRGINPLMCRLSINHRNQGNSIAVYVPMHSGIRSFDLSAMKADECAYFSEGQSDASPLYFHQAKSNGLFGGVSVMFQKTPRGIHGYVRLSPWYSTDFLMMRVNTSIGGNASFTPTSVGGADNES